MPRHPRLFIPEATYHVYCRVARGEFVFDNRVEADGFVEAARKVCDLDDWRIIAWVLMGNHYHLVVKTGSILLWRSMLRLQSEVARFGFRSTDAARLIGKHPTSISRWLGRGLSDLKSSPNFRRRIDGLDRKISRSARTNPSL